MIPEMEQPGRGRATSERPRQERPFDPSRITKAREHLSYVAANLEEILTVGTHNTDFPARQALDELDRAIWLLDGAVAA